MKKHTLKKALALFLMLAMVVPCLPVIAWAGDAPSFTEQLENYDNATEFIIYDRDDLKAFMECGKSFAGKTVKLNADIPWNEGTANSDGTFTPKDGTTAEAWTPIETTFGGETAAIFDGQGHTISGLNIDITSATTNIGFFETIQNAQIKNVIFNNCSIVSDQTNSYIIGFVAGIAYGSNTFSNVHVNAYQKHSTNTWNGRLAQVGGICGQLYSINSTNTFENCTVNGGITVWNSYVVGGIVGLARTTTTKVIMTDCVNYAYINAKNYAAGLVGRLYGAYSRFTRCTSVGKVYASETATETTFVHSASLVAMYDDSTNTAELPVYFTDCYHAAASNTYAVTIDSTANPRFKVTVGGTATSYAGTDKTTPDIATELTKKFSLFATGSTSAVVVDGVQQSLDKTAARFVSKVVFNINQTQDNIAAVGFEVSCLGQEATAKDCGHVYKTIYSTYNGVTTPIVAGEGEFEGVDYLATVVIPDIPANETKTLLVRGYLKNPKADGTFATVYSNQSSLLVTFANGNIVGIAYV